MPEPSGNGVRALRNIRESAMAEATIAETVIRSVTRFSMPGSVLLDAALGAAVCDEEQFDKVAGTLLLYAAKDRIQPVDKAGLEMTCVNDNKTLEWIEDYTRSCIKGIAGGETSGPEETWRGGERLIQLSSLVLKLLSDTFFGSDMFFLELRQNHLHELCMHRGHAITSGQLRRGAA